MRSIQSRNGKVYPLHSVIGQGSFGTVYYSPPYAIKQVSNVNKTVKQALKNQTSIMQQLNHPNIVKLYEIIEEGNSLYMVMEYCQLDLSHYLKKYKLDQGQAVSIFRQLMQGMRCLVQRGVIHRDLKPANILVNSRGQFKLADFGLARYVNQFDSSLLRTIAGTPIYMAPQILKKSPYTTKCDIWSSGVIFYQILTKNLPWIGSTQRQLYINITTKPLRIPSILSQWSKHVITRMLIVGENQRIGWDQLFNLLNTGNNSNRKRSRDRPTSATSQRPIAQRSPKKISKQTISFPPNKLKQMLVLDLQQILDEWTSKQIVFDSSFILTPQQQDKVREVLTYYCVPLQSWYIRQIAALKSIA